MAPTIDYQQPESRRASPAVIFQNVLEMLAGARVWPRVVAGLVGCSLLLGYTSARPAVADDDSGPSAAVIKTVEAVADSVVSEGTSPIAHRVSYEAGVKSYEYRAKGGATVSVDAASGAVELSGKRGRLTVAIPQVKAVEYIDGDVVMESRGEFSVAPLAHPDGSVQITVVVDGRESPSEYEFKIDAGRGSLISIAELGAVLITDSEGNLISGAGPAWAYDADGKSVPTHYLVRGGSLVQVVDHQSGDFKYPIVADPWLGMNLFSWITVDTYNKQPRVNLKPSPWGLYVWTGSLGAVLIPGVGLLAGFAAGQYILNTSGWSEAWNWNSTVRAALNKASQRQQFECHALGGAFDIGGNITWNLEKYRVTRTKSWTVQVWNHLCNWKTADKD